MFRHSEGNIHGTGSEEKKNNVKKKKSPGEIRFEAEMVESRRVKGILNILILIMLQVYKTQL